MITRCIIDYIKNNQMKKKYYKTEYKHYKKW